MTNTTKRHISLGQGNYTRRQKPMVPVRVDDYDDLLDFLKKHRRTLMWTREEWHDLQKEKREAEKAKSPWLVGGPCEGIRNNANVKSRILLTLDLECKDKTQARMPPWPTFRRRMREAADGFVGLVTYKSTGYKDDDPRYRIFVLLDKPIENRNALKHLSLLVARRLNIEAWCRKESYSWSSPMVLPVDFQEPEGMEELGAGADSGLVYFSGLPLDVEKALLDVAAEMADTPTLWDTEIEPGACPEFCVRGIA